MSESAVVRSRIDPEIKQQASAVLERMGLTVSDVMRIVLTRVARDHALPFDPFTPNRESVKAMKEARTGKLRAFDTVDALMADLNADD